MHKLTHHAWHFFLLGEMLGPPLLDHRSSCTSSRLHHFMGQHFFRIGCDEVKNTLVHWLEETALELLA